MTGVAVVVVSLLLSLWFGALGAGKVAATADMRERAAHVGVGVGAYRLIGALELLGAAGLLVGLAVPGAGFAAASGLLLLLAGAVVAHVRAGDPPLAAAPAIGSAAVVAAYAALLSVTGT